jgi:hypothetical protein
MPAPINLSTLPVELQSVWLDNPVMVQNAMFDAFTELRGIFNVIPSNGRTPFPVITLLDKLKIATNNFTPDELAELNVRIPALQAFEVDTELAYSDVEAYAQMWANGLFESRQMLKDTANFTFAQALLLKYIDEAFLNNFATKGAFYGTRTTDATLRGGDKIIDGLIKKISDGIADASIPTENVVECPIDAVADENEEAAYNNVQAVCKVAARKKELRGKSLICVVSEEQLELYSKHRAKLNPNFVGPGELATTPDFYKRITFKSPAGMQDGSDIIVTHDKNLYLGLEDDTAKYRVRVKDAIKSTQINVKVAAFVDFAIGQHLVTSFKA